MKTKMLGKSKLEDAVLDAIIEDPAKLEEQLSFLVATGSITSDRAKSLKEEIIIMNKCIETLKERIEAIESVLNLRSK